MLTLAREKIVHTLIIDAQNHPQTHLHTFDFNIVDSLREKIGLTIPLPIGSTRVF
jgi:hypothetical protein